ncbi:peroxiredoxin 2 isoform X1 [Palaemon carinicauda]|uniref:peroxiredoxin 2 isoform X1 n=1 Tax=Palaemon carinicauda TaxID=392227 RepID=UPI0035B58134
MVRNRPSVVVDGQKQTTIAWLVTFTPPNPNSTSNFVWTVKELKPKKEGSKSTMSNQVPAITKPAPVFKGTAVVDGQFKEISLADYQGKYVVFFFYPLDFTFVCPTEIIAFSDRAKEFRDINCEVIACSTDSHFSHLAWINTPRKEGGLGEMNIPLLADKSMDIARSYGVLKEEDGIAFRGLFIIDGKGNLRQATINDLPVGRDVDETLRLVQAFQFTDEHGEVCPAGWKPGAKTMKADPTGSKEYFQSEN